MASVNLTLDKNQLSNVITGDIEKLQKIINSDATMLELHNVLAKFCDPFVPYLNGPLSLSGMTNITASGVEYITPYAVKQYYLHDMNDDLAGTTNRTRTVHPLASSYWDKTMMQMKGLDFIAQIQVILLRRLSEI